MAYGLLSLARIWLFGSGVPTSLASTAVWVIAIALFAFVSRSLYVGRNWVRWLVAGLVACSVALLPIYKPELPSGSQLGIYILQFILPVVSSALTFTRAARIWFQA